MSIDPKALNEAAKIYHDGSYCGYAAKHLKAIITAYEAAKVAGQPCVGVNKAALDQASAARKKFRSDTPTTLYSIEGEDAVFIAAYLEAVSADQPDELTSREQAFTDILTGGNHLASALMQKWPPTEIKDYDTALVQCGQPYADMWIAWHCIMTARPYLREPERESGDETHRMRNSLEHIKSEAIANGLDTIARWANEGLDHEY